MLLIMHFIFIFSGTNGIRRLGESKKFRFYCFYAFGLPALMVLFSVLMDSMSPEYVPSYMTPRIGYETCFFKSIITLCSELQS